jgi:branched-chain amino acid aminotransferase
MARIIAMNFEIVDPSEAKVSVMDRSFLYGDSVYEVVRTYGGTRLFMLDRHFARLLKSSGRIGLEIPFSLPQLEKHLSECVRAAQNPDSYVRVVVSRGADTRFNLIPAEGISPLTVVYVDSVPVFPDSYYSEGIPISLVNVRRNLIAAVDPNTKTGNYMNNMLALMESQKSGAVEAIMLNHDGNVTEATTSNVFMVKGDVVMTPAVSSGLLEGVSRALLKDVMQKNGIAFQEKAISEAEFRSADEIFITGTIKEVMPVSRMDGKPVGKGKPGPMTRKLMGLWREITAR